MNSAEYSNRNGCSICHTEFNSTDVGVISYPDLVCDPCSRKQVNAEGERPGAEGHGPYFIDGIKCWRRAYATMRDFGDCATWDEFAARNKDRFAW